MKKVILFIALMMLCIGFSSSFASSGKVDMTEGRSNYGIRIDSIQPPMLPIQSQSFNTITFRGDIGANIDSSTIQLYRIDGDEPLLNVLRHYSYGNGASVDFKYKEGFTPVHDETYRFEFKHDNADIVMVYYIRATEYPMLEVTEDLMSGTKHLGYVMAQNARLFDVDNVFEEMYLVDSSGKHAGAGTFVMINGQANITFETEVPLVRGERYYVKSTNKNAIITYSSFLNRNFLIVTDAPKIQSLNRDLFEYSRDHNDYYMVELCGLNIDPETMDSMVFEQNILGTFDKRIYSDVLTNEMVEVDYDPNYGEYEKLTLKIDKDYIQTGFCNIYINKLGNKYDTHKFMTCDDGAKYRNYAPGYEPILYEHDFYMNDTHYDFEGTDMSVSVLTFDKQSKVTLDISRYKDDRGGHQSYDESLKMPTFDDTDLITSKIVSEVLNIKQSDYRKTQTFEITMDLTSEKLAEPGVYTFYQYDYLLDKWLPRETTVDPKRKVISMKTQQLGQFLVVNYQSKFYDIRHHWASADLIDMSSQGLISGYNGLFRPNDTINRAEFVTMVVKMLELEQANVVLPYEDVEKAHWAYRFVMTAYQNGLIAEKETFGANDIMTRSEMATIIAKAFRLNNGEIDVLPEVSFIDCDALDAQVFRDVALIKHIGVINGRSHEYFAPDDPASRAEAVIIIKRLLDYLSK